jgi:hypothetical protein
MESAARGLDANPTRAFSLGGAESTGSFPAGVQFRVALRRRSFLVWSAMRFMWCRCRIRRRVRAVSAVPKRREEGIAWCACDVSREAGWMASSHCCHCEIPTIQVLHVYLQIQHQRSPCHALDGLADQPG